MQLCKHKNKHYTLCYRSTDNYTYFGDIFNVPGSRGANTVECGNPTCRADLT